MSDGMVALWILSMLAVLVASGTICYRDARRMRERLKSERASLAREVEQTRAKLATEQEAANSQLAAERNTFETYVRGMRGSLEEHLRAVDAECERARAQLAVDWRRLASEIEDCRARHAEASKHIEAMGTEIEEALKELIEVLQRTKAQSDCEAIRHAYLINDRFVKVRQQLLSLRDLIASGIASCKSLPVDPLPYERAYEWDAQQLQPDWWHNL